MTDWHTPAELAEHYKVSRRSIYRAIAAELLGHSKLPCIRVSEVDRLKWEAAGRPTKKPKQTKKPRRLNLSDAQLIARHLGV